MQEVSLQCHPQQQSTVWYTDLLSGLLFSSFKSLQFFLYMITELGFLNAEFTMSLLYLQTAVSLHWS